MSQHFDNNLSPRTIQRQRQHSYALQRNTSIPRDSPELKFLENLAKLRFSFKLEENFQFAIKELSARHLNQDALMLHELHASLKKSIDKLVAESSSQPIRNENNVSHYDIYVGDVIEDFRDNMRLTDSPNYFSPKHYLVKSLFEAREFGRAHMATIELCPSKSDLFRFLWGYSDLLAGEPHTPFQDITERFLLRTLEPNTALKSIWDHLYPLFCKNRSNIEKDVLRLDPFCLYLLGIAAVGLENYNVAQEALLGSIKLFPYNWSAWVELGKCILSQTKYLAIMEQVPMCIMREFFCMHMDPKFNLAKDKLEQHANILVGLFPDSQTVLLQKGVALYYYSDHALALQLFESVYSKDKHILDYADIYSHLLFVMKDKVRLSCFAKRCFELGRLRPEIYCVIGNLHAAEKNYSEAISYFCKAIKLDHSFLSAWIYAGDSYMMLDEPLEAFRSYRMAFSISSNNYHICLFLASFFESSGENGMASQFYSMAFSIRPKTLKV